MIIKKEVFQAYRDFIRTNCKVERCKDCRYYKGKCYHENHPAEPLFSKP